MRLVQKEAIARFSNQTYSLASFMDLMGRQPHLLPGYVRMKKQKDIGFMSIVETLGNIYYDDPQAFTKLTEIDTYSYTWRIDTSQIPTLRITRPCNQSGANGEIVQIYMDDRFFSKYDVFSLINGQQLFVISEPTRISASEFLYECRLVTSNPNEVLNNAFTQINSTARYVYNLHPEFSEYGTNKMWYNMETHTNWLSKIRAGQSYSSDLRAAQDLFFMTESDYKKAIDRHGGGYKIYVLTSIEQQVLDHFMRTANGVLLFGRSVMSEQNGRSLLQTDRGEDIIAGDGLIAQYERYAHYIDYSENSLNVRHFQDAIEYVAERRGQSTGNHITVVCNRRFSRQKARALQSELFAQNPYGAWFFTKEKLNREDPITKSRYSHRVMANEIAVGATFNTYIYEGNTITFVVDEALTQYYKDQDRGYAIFIDTGLYETDNGTTPAVHLKTLKGRSMVKGHIPGMGGVSGTSNGIYSTALDASRFEIVGWRGVCVMNPYAATIMIENK
ncbi:MAG: hypothetical protein NZZ41_02305 [Candidatus Dojkabacteria bacterium]|nr:hypothetical protein [Candidatus Dojkabacteria bacterium]